MRRLIEFPIESGGTILVEVEMDDAKQAGWIPAAARSIDQDVPAKAAMTFEAAMDKIKPSASAIIKKLRSISDPPNEMTVVFGLKLSAESGVVVAAAGIEANYTVTLKWTREDKKEEKK